MRLLVRRAFVVCSLSSPLFISTDHNGLHLQLNMWELAGEGRYKLLYPHYYSGAQGAIFVYDVTSRDTFERVRQLIDDLNKYSIGRMSEVTKLLIANKVDKRNREVAR